MYKIDFHTHSIMSYDGSITEKEYEEMFTSKKLDYIAITDHNRIDFAQKMHKKLADRIIVGEEILTYDGEIIGLFLTKKIEARLPIAETIKQIHKQGGLVYIPHPYDTLRNGIGHNCLVENYKNIDIIEGFNGRMIFRWQNKTGREFAKEYKIPIATGSDAHSIKGLGKSYTLLGEKITKKNLLQLLDTANYRFVYQQWYAYIYPFLNKVKKKVRLG